MNTDIKILLGTLVVFSALVGAVKFLEMSADQQIKAEYPNADFVCYTDGKLTERHVVVETARVSPAGVWDIQYSDGLESVYLQKPGESCGIERYPDYPTPQQ